MTLFRTSLAAVLLSACALSAHASVVTFSGEPAKTFADGSFSWHLDGDGNEVGFYPLASQFGERALNSSGTGETIYFTSPVYFNALTFEAAAEAINPAAITVSLYDAHANLLAAQGFAIDMPFFPDLTLTFDQAGVAAAAITLDYDAAFGQYATFIVKNVTYGEVPAGSVPEPASLALLGLGVCAALSARRKRG